MSPKRAQRFWDLDVYESKDSTRVVCVPLDATRLMT